MDFVERAPKREETERGRRSTTFIEETPVPTEPANLPKVESGDLMKQMQQNMTKTELELTCWKIAAANRKPKTKRQAFKATTLTQTKSI